jgi:predicted phage terminase large subunit-like protein
MMAMGENKFVENPDKKPAPPFLSTKTIKERKLLQRRQAELKDQLKSIQKRKELEEVREKGLEDFYFFCKNVMGFKDLYEPLHRPLCEFIANPDSKRKMILIPRGHFKTTIGSISYPIWKLLRNREERIGLMSVTSDLAEDHLRELIMKIDDTRTQALYSHKLPPSSTWPLRRGFEYRCPRRGSKVGPSLYACGVESSETGRHFSTIIIDDMVNDQNTRNRAQLERIWDWFSRQGSVLDSDGEFLVLGTRWHWGDPYGRLQEKKDWEKMILSATTKSGSLIFPTVFSKEFLEEKRRDQGDYRYSCFYENNPSGAGLNPFDIKRFSWVDYRERHPDAHRYLLIDPATTTNEWSHPTGIVIGDALAKEKTFVVTECIREKLEPDSLVNRIIGLCKKHDPYEIVIEADSAHKIFVSWLKREFAKKKLSYHIHSMKNPVKIGRETRTINTLQPRVHNGEVVFADNMIGREMLLEEFQSFPRGKSDDLVMALSAVLVVTYPRGYEKPKRKRIDRRTAIFNNIIARNGTANRKKRPVPRTRLRLY